MEKVARQTVYPGIAGQEEEIHAYFDAEPEGIRPPRCRCAPGRSSSAARRRGSAFSACCARGSLLPRWPGRHSLSPDSEEGGDLGFFGRGEMPAEFEEVVFALPVGRISDLVKSEYGYHIFLVEERRNAVRLKLEQVREEIRARLQAEKEEQAYQGWLQNLRGKATIEIDWSLL